MPTVKELKVLCGGNEGEENRAQKELTRNLTFQQRNQILLQCMQRLAKVKIKDNPPVGFVEIGYVMDKLEMSRPWVLRHNKGLKAVHHPVPSVHSNNRWFYKKAFIDQIARLKCHLEAQLVQCVKNGDC